MPAVVLVEPREPGNIGSAARAMSNMGLSRLLLVTPADHRGREAEKMALGGKEILRGAELYDRLEDAVAGFDLVVGTTRREGSVREGRISPRTAAAEIAGTGNARRAALVFGRERSGLTNREVDLCHMLVTIPTSAESRSLNLAQAVVVFAYEVFLAAAPEAATGGEARPRNVASHGELEGLFEHMEEVLLRVGYLHGDNPQRMMRTFRRIFARAALDGREVRALRGIFHQVAWYVDREGTKTGGATHVDKR